MSVGKICTRSVSVASPDESIAVAARRMAEHDVGTLVVAGTQGEPTGLLTDRDVVLRVVAKDRDPASTPVREVMSQPPACVYESTPIEDALSQMARTHGRRLVVIDEEGRLVGLLALDDVIDLVAEEAQSIGRLLRR